MCLYSRDYTIIHNEKWRWKWKIDHMDTTKVDLGLDMDINIVNEVSHIDDAYMY